MGLPSYELLPFEGVAEARLGESRASLQRRLGERSTFRKGSSELGLADHYVARGLILHHDDRDRLFYLEISDALLRYRGVQLLDRPYGEVLAELGDLGCRYVEDDDGCEFPDLGFNLWPGGRADEPISTAGMFLRDRPGGGFAFVGDGDVEPIRDHVLVPYEGTDQIRLGAGRLELRALLGRCMEAVPDYGAAAQDHYIEHGLTLGFGDGDRLISIAISSLAKTVTYQGVHLYNRPYPEVIAELAGQGVPVEQGELIGRAPGFALLLASDYAPDLPVAAVRVDRQP